MDYIDAIVYGVIALGFCALFVFIVAMVFAPQDHDGGKHG